MAFEFYTPTQYAALGRALVKMKKRPVIKTKEPIKSGVRGVYMDRMSNMWIAHVQVSKGVFKSIGRFKTVDEAAQAINDHKKPLFSVD